MKALWAFTVLLGSLLLVSSAAAEEVRLPTLVPLEVWCVHPHCADRRKIVELPSPLKLEPREQGYLEKRFRGALIDEVRRLLDASVPSSRASRDLLGAMLAVMLDDQVRLTAAGGLGAAVARAGLVYEMDRTLPSDVRCRGTARLDAIYEGLALSAIGALGFTEATRAAQQECVDVAKEAARGVGRAAVRALTNVDADVVGRPLALLGEAGRACSANASDDETAVLGAFGAASSVAEARELLVRIHRLPPNASPLDRCATALDALRSVSSSSLDAIASAGLGETRVDVLASLMSPPRCEALETSCAARLEVESWIATLVREQTLSYEVLERLVASASARATEGLTAATPRVLQALGRAVVRRGASATIDPNRFVVEAERTLGMHDGRLAAGELLGLPPSPWLVEMNAGIPKLDGGDVRVAGDAKLGYESRDLSVVAWTAVRYFDLTSRIGTSDSVDASGAVEGSFLSGDERSRVRAQVGLSAGAAYVDTTTLTRGVAAGPTRFGDYDSFLARAAATVALRARVDRTTLVLSASLGGQYETYDSTSVDARGVAFESPDTVTVQARGRLDMRHRVVSEIVSVRARAEVASFALTRESLVLENGGGATLTSSMTRQLLLVGQVFVDLDVLRFAGFVPAAFGRVDHVSFSGGGADAATTVPVLGVGLIHSAL